MQNVVSVRQFKDKKILLHLFEAAKTMQEMPIGEYPKPLKNLTMATIFYEPSTRTRLSFETAIQNLGANLLTTENAGEFSSAIKGETIEDTIKVINAYADGIVIRHPEAGAAERAAAVSGVPIFNAGDGAGEHPTQALLDLYTIYRSRGTLDGLKIGLVGDLLYSRTIHSLLPLLSLYKVEIFLISPKELELPSKYLADVKEAKIVVHQMNDWDSALDQVDVLYMTRVQKERFKLIEDYTKVKDHFILNLSDVSKMKKNAIILHPLPRVNEISTDVDDDPRAKYFEQVRNGLFMRMALLNYIYTS